MFFNGAVFLASLSLIGTTTYLALNYKNKKTAEESSLISQEEFKNIYLNLKRISEERDYINTQSKIYFDSCDEFSVEDCLPEIIKLRIIDRNGVHN